MLISQDAFFADVANGLAGCQKVEQYLKLYIHEAFDFARVCIDGRMPFYFCGDNVKDASLERLIEIFKKLTDDNQLVKDLYSFKDERNYLSHCAITNCHDGGGDYCEHLAGKARSRILAVESTARQLADRLWQQRSKILVSRYFEDLTKSPSLSE